MSNSSIRVWVEDIDPPSVLRFTWQTPEDSSITDDAAMVLVREALTSAAGVEEVREDEAGLVVVVQPDAVTRYELAAAIRTALQRDVDDAEPVDPRIRVWAEDFSATEMRLTWSTPEGAEGEGDRHQRRRVAAWIAAMPGVRSAALDDVGVVVRYDPEVLDRARVGDDVRLALDDDTPLRDRADELLKRAKTYGNLAGKLALDDRISPLPEAAKQAVAARTAGGGRNTAMQTAMRFVPGATLITRVQTILPVLTELSKWSREADPAVVDGHLASVGLDRETLRRDTITAHEIRYYARDSAADHAAVLGEKAAAGAKQALATGREILASMRRALDVPDGAAETGRTSSTTSAQSEIEAPSPQQDSSPADPD